MVTDGGLSVLEISKRLSLPKSTLEHWIKVSKAGHLGKIGKGQRPLTKIERELARVKRELSLARMERDILKKAAAYFAKESLQGTR
jgi:transposase